MDFGGNWDLTERMQMSERLVMMQKILGQMNREWNGTKLTEYPQSSLESPHIKCYDKKWHATFGHQTDARA